MTSSLPGRVAVAAILIGLSIGAAPPPKPPPALGGPDAPSEPSSTTPSARPPHGPGAGGPKMGGRRIEPMTVGAGPQGLDGKALVLFDGTDWSGWHSGEGDPSDWQLQGDGSVKVGTRDAITQRTFGDFQLHLEFLCPDMKGATGQAKANSGVYLHGLYELQILDSYGLSPSDGRCGGIYSKAAPLTNAALPPSFWQSYDIFFRAPRLAADGTVTEKPRLTVLHNGVLIHNALELDGPTPGGLGEAMTATGPVVLQAHGDPVLFRNIWIRPG